jgi:predicted ester cyclase
MKRKSAVFVIAILATMNLACAADPTEHNKDVVQRMTDAINARDFDALDDLVAADVHRHSAATPGVAVENLEQFKAFLHQDLAAVPDAQQEIRLMLAEGDLVAVRAIYRGTQSGQMGPFPPSGLPVEIPFIGILRIEEGKVAEIWVEWDNLNALVQLGHFQPPAMSDGQGDDG